MSDGGEAAEWLTIEAAAAHLSVSIPRLRRLLTRADFAPLVETRTRQTRTRTRTAQGVPVLVLVSLRDALDTLPSQEGQSGKGPNENEPEQERERAEPFETVLVPVSVPVSSDAALVAHLQSEVSFLREALKAEQGNAAALTSELSKANERAAVLIAAVGSGRLQLPPMDAQNDAQNDAQESTAGDLRGDCGEVAQTAAHDKPRPFWAFWQKKEGG